MMSRKTRKADGCAWETEAHHPGLAAGEAQLDSKLCQLIQGRQDEGNP